MASVFELWILDEEYRFPTLTVVLHQQTFVLPWTQFICAEGAPDRIRAVFTTHNLLVTGLGLDVLLADFTVQKLTRFREPARSERFGLMDYYACCSARFRASKLNRFWAMCFC